MSDAEHLIENAIMALERYPYEEVDLAVSVKRMDVVEREN